VPSLSPRRRHSVSLPETAPTGPPQRIDQPTTPTPNPSKSTIAAITITHATNGTLISGSLGVVGCVVVMASLPTDSVVAGLTMVAAGVGYRWARRHLTRQR